MNLTTRKKSWADFWIRFFGIAFLGVAITAHAQVPSADETPPLRSFIDANGVDLMTGNFYLFDRQVSVGTPGNGGLTRTYIGVIPNPPEWARDSLMGIIDKSGT